MNLYTTYLFVLAKRTRLLATTVLTLIVLSACSNLDRVPDTLVGSQNATADSALADLQAPPPPSATTLEAAARTSTIPSYGNVSAQITLDYAYQQNGWTYMQAFWSIVNRSNAYYAQIAFYDYYTQAWSWVGGAAKSYRDANGYYYWYHPRNYRNNPSQPYGVGPGRASYNVQFITPFTQFGKNDWTRTRAWAWKICLMPTGTVRPDNTPYCGNHRYTSF